MGAPSSPGVANPNGSNTDPLAAFRRDNDPQLVDWLKVGAAEQARRTGRDVPQRDLDALDWLHSNGSSLCVATAAEDYTTWLADNAAALGYTHIETTRSQHGRRTTTTRRVTTKRARPGRYWFASVASTRPTSASKVTTSVTPRGRSREHRPASRRTSSSSISSGTDPGSDSSSDPDEPEPPASGRPCSASWCGNRLYGSPQKKYCDAPYCKRTRDHARQNKCRHGSLNTAERDRLTNARLVGMAGDRAFAPAEEHSLSFLWKFGLAPGDDPGERDAIALFRRGSSQLEGVIVCS